MAKMTGAQCLADMLAGYGVTHVFMVPAVLRRTFAEMERRTRIKRIHTHGEKSAAYMADGYVSPRACATRISRTRRSSLLREAAIRKRNSAGSTRRSTTCRLSSR